MSHTVILWPHYPQIHRTHSQSLVFLHKFSILTFLCLQAQHLSCMSVSYITSQSSQLFLQYKFIIVLINSISLSLISTENYESILADIIIKEERKKGRNKARTDRRKGEWEERKDERNQFGYKQMMNKISKVTKRKNTENYRREQFIKMNSLLIDKTLVSKNFSDMSFPPHQARHHL